MRTVVLIISLIIGAYLCQLAYKNIDLSFKLNRTNKGLVQKLNNLEIKESELTLLEDQPIGSLEESYKEIIKKIRLFSRSQDLKTVIDFQKNINRITNGFKNKELTSFRGIEQMPMEIKFISIKGEEGVLKIIGFLDQLESSNSLRVMNIYQSQDSLQTRVQVYGREI